MKHLTIKKIALGLFLAGYATSGAFAAQTATTNKTIQGNMPSLAKKGSALTGAGALPISDIDTITVSAGAGNAVSGKVSAIGDKVIFEFETLDEDGDTATTTKGAAANLVVYYGTTNASNVTTWKKADNTDSNYAIDAANKVTFTVGTDGKNADKIGFRVQAETQYGDPKLGNWLIGDISIPTKPGIVAPSGSAPVNPGNPSPQEGTGDTTVPVVKIPSTDAIFGIFKVDSDSGNLISSVITDNYTNSGSANPQLGDTFEMVYWDDANSDGIIDGSEIKYTITGAQWNVADGNNAAGGSLTSDYILNGETNVQITLPSTNSLPAAWTTLATAAPEAGVQGFKLQATATNP